MKRRGFLGFLGGAIAAGPSAARAAIDTTLADAGFATQGLMAAPTMSECVGPDHSPEVTNTLARRMIKWIRKGGIPEWKMNEIRRRADERRTFGLDPDLACLRSVSPGFKARTQRARNIEREIEKALTGLDADLEERAFHEKMRKKFGTSIGWYQ